MNTERKPIAVVAVVAAALVLGAAPARAQFGGLLKKAKETVKKKVEKKADEKAWEAKQAGNKAVEEAKEKALHKVPCPWTMDPDSVSDSNRSKVQEYIKNLGKADPADVDSLKEQMKRRWYENDEILKARGYDDVWNAPGREGKELKLLQHFYSDLNQDVIVFHVDGTLTKNKKGMEFRSIRVDVGTTSYYIILDENSKMAFHTMGGDKIFVEDEQLPEVKEFHQKLANAKTLFEGIGSDDAIICGMCYNFMSQALENNAPGNIGYRPYPKGGSLNSLAGKALAVIKKTDAYKDAIAVVIDADSWTIDKNAFGIPIRRKCGGWAIRNDKHGKRAYRVMFAEDYDGTGYGALHMYGQGMGSHYVK